MRKYLEVFFKAFSKKKGIWRTHYLVMSALTQKPHQTVTLLNLWWIITTTTILFLRVSIHWELNLYRFRRPHQTVLLLDLLWIITTTTICLFLFPFIWSWNSIDYGDLFSCLKYKLEFRSFFFNTESNLIHIWMVIIRWLCACGNFHKHFTWRS